MDLRGVIELHVYAGPDVRPRKMDALTLARVAKAAGVRALLLKAHTSNGCTCTGIVALTGQVSLR